MSTVTDPIADLLTRLRNARSARITELTLPHSRIKADIVRILKQEGYIADYEIDTSGTPARIKILNKPSTPAPAITGLKRISKPGLRKYVGSGNIPRVLGGMGIAILSTPKGVLTDREARKENVGGELLAYVW